jgi:hypothetical protein
MGRKKKGKCSCDQLLKAIEKVVLPVSSCLERNPFQVTSTSTQRTTLDSFKINSQKHCVVKLVILLLTGTVWKRVIPILLKIFLSGCIYQALRGEGRRALLDIDRKEVDDEASRLMSNLYLKIKAFYMS